MSRRVESRLLCVVGSTKNRNELWWRQAVFYQIYPLSFADSDGDGFGDIAGIISKLGYLSETLGVDALWISPFYKSPMKDWGYDISDHCDVDPLFGDMGEAKELINQAHDHGLKVIVDYVPSHTSDQHPWFIESRMSRDNPKRDWYVWRDGRDGGPPNNWVSVFSGPAWTLDEITGQWYRHTYLHEQPDLNWRNPEVVDEMMEVLRFWMELGVDGFRVDAAHQMMKDPEDRDNPPAPLGYRRPWKDMGEYDEFVHLYDFGHQDVHHIHRRIRDTVDSFGRDIVTVGEIHIFDLPEWASYYGEQLDQLHMPFNFHLMASNWDVPNLRATIEAVLWHVPVGGWTNWTMGNHDEIRVRSRLPEGHDRLAALLLLTLRGSPFLYYGDELGMSEAEIAHDQRRDPWGRRVSMLSRDGARTPMQWSNGPNAGFSTPGSEPWLPVGSDRETANVESQVEDPGSMLNMFRRLLALRKELISLRLGSFLTHPASTDEVLVYRREADHETSTVALNFSDQEQSVSVRRGHVRFSTIDPDRDERFSETVELSPCEGVIVIHP